MFISLVFLCHATAIGGELDFKLFDAAKKSYRTVTMIERDGVTISKGCLKSGKMKCQAWAAVSKKIARAATPGVGVVGNPAARYCFDHNANNRILLDSKKREYDYCVFGDGSMIDSWSLFYKHFGK